MGKIDLPAVIETAVQSQKIDLSNVNFLLPTKTFGQVLGKYDKIVIEVIQIDPEEDAFEIAKDKYSPGKRPLMAISNALDQLRLKSISATRSHPHIRPPESYREIVPCIEGHCRPCV